MPTKTTRTSTCSIPLPAPKWRTFPEMLQQLHQSGIYLEPGQLAEFLVLHGLPVDLCYVPAHLQQRATMINRHYQGDMARLEASTEQDSGYLEQLFKGR